MIGSLRIDDFRTTTPLGPVIVPRRRPAEIWIYDFIEDDDVGWRASGLFSRRFWSLFSSFRD